jgi:hypothetical protein
MLRSAPEEQKMKRIGVFVVMGALVLGLAGPSWAQKSVSEGVTTQVSATIESIDYKERKVALRTEDGRTETVFAGPDLKRFDELKVGDRVNFQYTEILAYDLRKPGEASKAQAAAAVSRNPGDKPSGTFYQTETATVTVMAVDPKVPSITVKSAEGKESTHLVKEENKKALDNVKAGDRIDITYTEKLTITVVAPKK